MSQPAPDPAWARLVHTLREMLSQVVQLEASAPQLEALGQQAERLRDALAERAVGRSLPAFHFLDGVLEQPERLHQMMPFNPMCGELNPIAPKLRFSRDDSRLIAEISFPAVYEGPVQCVHGGVLSLFYDQLLSNVAIMNGLSAPTASLTVNYRAPTPLHTSLQFSAGIDRVEGRKVYLRGSCRHEGKLLTDAEGLFIRVLPERAAASGFKSRS